MRDSLAPGLLPSSDIATSEMLLRIAETSVVSADMLDVALMIDCNKIESEIRIVERRQSKRAKI